jgi:aldose 1-epimerase
MYVKKIFIILFTLSFIFSFISCSVKKEVKPTMKKENFGHAIDGKQIFIYTLKNSKEMEVKITNYGGIVVALSVPDRKGKFEDIVLGFEKLEDYTNEHPYFGALIGRYGNRVQNGKFSLNGTEYILAKNDKENSLHGGLKGFDKVVWDTETKKGENSLTLSYLSKDGEEGYPGNLSVKVIYTLTDSNELKIEYTATTDKPTVLNLTHHSYFNLAGAGNSDVLSHELMLNADKFTPVDSGLIPTGEMKSVQGTPMDFTKPTQIGARINQNDEQLKLGKGYDHNWILNKTGNELSLAAKVYEPTSGRVMEVYTTEPGIQFYSGNFLDGSNIGKNKKRYNHRYGFCLETQHFPDSPNKPNFPTTVLNPGDTYKQTTIYKFSSK